MGNRLLLTESIRNYMVEYVPSTFGNLGGDVRMEEKSAEFLGNYDFNVHHISRVRGAYVLATDKGTKLLKEYGGTEKRAFSEQKVMQHIKAEGMPLVDCYVPNKEGNLITKDEYGTSYVIKDWFLGEECNIKRQEKCLLAVHNLAKLHNCLTDLELTEEECAQMAQKNLKEVFQKRNRELKRVYSYIKERRQKCYFEVYYLNTFSAFYEEALKAEELLGKISYESCYKTAKKTQVCHGNYNHHNILLLPDGKVATTNFDRMEAGIQMSDFYLFFRKVMEKTDWNVAVAEAILASYQKERSVAEEEWAVLYLLLLYPEKFWKITNCYYNSKKTWIPEKNTEKLITVKEQIEKKQQVLQEIILPHFSETKKRPAFSI